MQAGSEYWGSALKGEFLPITEGRPEVGFYCIKRADNRIPVAIDDAFGEAVVILDGHIIEERDQAAIWIACAKHPVTEDAYNERRKTGRWPDEVVSGIDQSNLPADPRERIACEIEDLIEQSDSLTAVADQAAADKVANYRDRLRRLSNEADEKRAIEKRPHDEAGKKVQAKWLPMIDRSKIAYERLGGILQKFLTAEKRRLEEEARQRAEEERKALEAKQADLGADNLPAEPLAPSAPPKVQKARAGGAYASRTGLKTKTVVVITDYAAALNGLKDHPFVKEAVQKAAEAMVIKAKLTVPGVSTKEEHTL